MPSTNFSGRFKHTGGQKPQGNTPKKKHIVASFNMEQEDNIRILSRKLVEFVMEMKEDGLVPNAFGLIFKDQRLRNFFGLGEKPSVNLALLEYRKQKFDTIKAKVIETLVDSNIPIMQTKDGKDSSDIEVTRMLIDITSL